jgi:hypothetical protein
VSSFTLLSSLVTCFLAVAENVGKEVSVGTIEYIGKKNVVKSSD